jgi:hypothetical protein
MRVACEDRLPSLNTNVPDRCLSRHGCGLGEVLRALELLSSSSLSLSREILNLGLAEDDVGVRGGALEHIGLGDDEQDVLALHQSRTSNQ